MAYRPRRFAHRNTLPGRIQQAQNLLRVRFRLPPPSTGCATVLTRPSPRHRWPHACAAEPSASATSRPSNHSDRTTQEATS
jgi:hypothetical protein